MDDIEWPWRHVLITGASSGLGRALALDCAAPGVVLHLGGRDAARLSATATDCEAKGARATPRLIDVTDADAMAATATRARADVMRAKQLRQDKTISAQEFDEELVVKVVC